MESDSGPSSSALASDSGMAQSSGHTGPMLDLDRCPKHRDRASKSPRRRREGKRSQRQADGHQQLLREAERCRLPGQHEHLKACGSVSDTAESSPKRFALRVPAGQRCH